MISVGIDPGRKCGIAFVRGSKVPKLVQARTVNGDDLGVVVGCVQQIRRMADDHELIVVLELQFQNRGQRQNFKAMETLYYRRFVWEICCKLYRLDVRLVWPSTWQTQLKLAARYDPHGKRRTTKARSMDVAEFFWGKGAVADPEQADASLIARWNATQPR